MLLSYLPILIFLIVGIFSGILFITLGYILGPKRPSKAKLDIFECGFHAFDDARMKFEVKYYLVAILFILFDLEVAFIFPWAVSFVDFGLYGFITIFIFLFILTLGFVYEWKKGALEWE